MQKSCMEVRKPQLKLSYHHDLGCRFNGVTVREPMALHKGINRTRASLVAS
jgi:hypothetical protein